MYTIIFKDNTIYNGNSFDGSWNKMPEKEIIKFEYSFLKKKIVLTNYEAYNHIYTNHCFANNTKIITGLYLMGKIKGQVFVFYYDFKLKKALSYFAKWKEELRSPIKNKIGITGWTKGVACTGWREGIKTLDLPKVWIERRN